MRFSTIAVAAVTAAALVLLFVSSAAAAADATGRTNGAGGDDGYDGFPYQPGAYTDWADKWRPVTGPIPQMVHDAVWGAPPAVNNPTTGWSNPMRSVANTLEATTGRVPDEILPEYLKPIKGAADQIENIARSEADYRDRDVQRAIDRVSQNPVRATDKEKADYQNAAAGKPTYKPITNEKPQPSTWKTPKDSDYYDPNHPPPKKPKPLTEAQWADQAKSQPPLDTSTLQAGSAPKPTNDINAGKPRLTPEQIEAGVDPSDPSSDPLLNDPNKPQTAAVVKSVKSDGKQKAKGADAAAAGAKAAAAKAKAKSKAKAAKLAKAKGGKSPAKEEKLNGNEKSNIRDRVKKALGEPAKQPKTKTKQPKKVAKKKLRAGKRPGKRAAAKRARSSRRGSR